MIINFGHNKSNRKECYWCKQLFIKECCAIKDIQEFHGYREGNELNKACDCERLEKIIFHTTKNSIDMDCLLEMMDKVIVNDDLIVEVPSALRMGLLRKLKKQKIG